MMLKKMITREETMPDNEIKDRNKEAVKPAPKPERKAEPAAGDGLKPRHKMGLVEILIFLLLAGVVFIFIFGMQQMQREKEQELALQEKFEEILPTFQQIAQAAKTYKENDEFGAWPIDIGEIADPTKINTPEFTFTWLEDGIVQLTTTKEFGKEGITVDYDLNTDSYTVTDPDPGVKPVIKDSWVNQ